MSTKWAEAVEAQNVDVNRSEVMFASPWNHVFPFSGHEEVRMAPGQQAVQPRIFPGHKVMARGQGKQ